MSTVVPEFFNKKGLLTDIQCISFFFYKKKDNPGLCLQWCLIKKFKMIHLDGIQWKYIHAGNDYVNTHSLAYTLNKFPFFTRKQIFFYFPSPQ